ncbi:IS1634 family transposase [Mycoplasma sp. 480]|uniref:IS1634 family transposase n=1 Tax=Mycoplasma sp. 480 TaxID=3440155 RepID=UPI003F51675D
MKNHFILECSNGNAKYATVVKYWENKKGYKKIASLGNIEKLEKINPKYLEIMRKKLREIDPKNSAEEIKNILLSEIKKDNIEKFLKMTEINLIYNVVKKLNIFGSLKESKHKDLEGILEYQIASKILYEQSIFQRFKNKEKFDNKITTSKNSFYRFLDVLVDNEKEIFSNLNNIITNETGRDIELVFYDSSTVYFESFQRNGLRIPGYSKDGKFKEDQVVIGMATDSNGIPIFIKVFKGNTADSSTMIPFIEEMKKNYNLKKVTIIADKGMSINKNLRYLEQKNIDFIISYRLKSSSKEFKEFALAQEGYIDINQSLKYKEYHYNSHWNGKRVNDTIRRRIVAFSKSKAKKDYEDRQILIKNFQKRQNKIGRVSAEEIIGIKKYKFFKRVGKMEFELDYEKIIEDEKFDGLYVYETSRLDLSPEQIIEIYHKQWQIEENFRTLKNTLKVRPIYVWKDSHILGHFILNFLALVVLKYSIFLINKFYKDNGVVDKITNDKFIEAFNSQTSVVTEFKGEIIKVETLNYKTNENNDNIKYWYDIKRVLSKMV